MKKKSIIIGVIVFAVMLFGSIFVIAESTIQSKWGAYLVKYAENENDDVIYATGKTAIIYKSDIERATYYYLLAGMSEEEANENAYEFCKEKEALFQEATRLGYTVSNDEINNYINELREMTKDASNKKDIYDVINQFDSEEAYWDYLTGVYRKNLPIQKMNTQKEREFFGCNKEASEESWLQYFAEWKKTLVDAEQFKRQ